MSNFMGAALTVDDIYPVGSIYMSVNAVDPAKLFGGTWERIQEQFLLAAGSTHEAGATGGSLTKSITVENLPAHSHGLNGHTHSWSGTTNSAGTHSHTMYYNDSGATGQGGGFPHNTGNTTAGNGDTLIQNLWWDGIRDPFISSTGAHRHSVSGTTGGNSGNTTNTGGGAALDITPPYLAVYIWKRTA